MSSATFLSACLAIGLGILCLSLLAAVVRVIKGPTLPDRVLALDMLVSIAIGLIAVLGIYSRYTYHVDIALALGLVGFLATVAFARFILTRGPDAVKVDEDSADEAGPGRQT